MGRQVAAALLMLWSSTSAVSARSERVETEIVRSYRTSERHGTGSGSSHGSTVLLERVVTQRPDGLELEYDLPRDATAVERAREWQFPARVFRPVAGPMRLLNRDALASRLSAWLTKAGLDRAACGRLYFTWTAFRVECEPEAVLRTIEELDLRAVPLVEGAEVRHRLAIAPAPLRRLAGSADRWTATLPVDPGAVQRERAETDVAVGELTRVPVTLADALRRRGTEQVSGTVTVTLEGGTDGAIRRVTETRLAIHEPGAEPETREETVTVERRRPAT